MADPEPTLHIVSHTHWDREWYQPFAGYRRRLVFFFDRLLDLLEADPSFHSFYLDGQTCVVDDYLEIRPEEEARLRGHLASGRLQMGPWFVMPDELLVSGESLVRNLLTGVRRCHDFRCEAVPMLHASDVFGHCSQMPQIMQGFGIETSMLLRGTSAEGEKSEMPWTGADGTRVWILKVFPDTGYCDIWTYRRTTDAERLRAYEQRKLELATTPVLIGLDGNDHQAPFGPIGQTVALMNAAFTCVHVRHSSMGDAVDELRKYLPEVPPADGLHFHGELRTPAKTGMWNEVFFGTASARVPTKQKHDRAQTLLIRVAEPLQAIARAHGDRPVAAYLNQAWDYLLKCHPHDSIVGCSTDQVDRDVHHRLDQVIELARDEIAESMLHLGQCLTASLPEADRGPALFIFNPSTAIAGPVVEVAVEVPHQAGKPPRPPALRDEAGNPIEATDWVLEASGVFTDPIARRITSTDYPRYGCRTHEHGAVDRWRASLALQVPALGYRLLQIGKPGRSKNVPATPATDQPAPVCLDREHWVIDNGLTSVSIHHDGTLTLCDRTTGRIFADLGRFEWCADKGNGWDFKPVDADADPNQPGQQISLESVKVRVLRDHYLQARVRISGLLRVPAGLDRTGTRVLSRTVAIPVRQDLTLDAGSRFLRVDTHLDNKARDFRLRLLFPTSLQTDTWWSDSAFDLVRRKIPLPDTSGWKERARPETPIHHFAAVHDGTIGLAVVSHGLQEACVLDTPERPIALTMLRCYSQKIGSGCTEATQHAGPFAATWHLGSFAPEDDAPSPELARTVDRLKVPLQCVSLCTQEAREKSPVRISDTNSFASLSAELVLSALYIDGEDVVVRVYNPWQEPRRGQLCLRLPALHNAQRTELSGTPIGAAINPGRDGLGLELRPGEVQTWKFLR